MASIYWLISFIVLIGIELLTMALTTIWFAGGALAAFLLSLFGASVEVQLTVFVVVSFILLFCVRSMAIRHLNSKTTKTNADSLIGTQARVLSEINNSLETGTVLAGGQEWTARSSQVL
ncbi:MAG: NfeD family protein [Hungatella sp.]